jgi:hypothetical protein
VSDGHDDDEGDGDSEDGIPSDNPNLPNTTQHILLCRKCQHPKALYCPPRPGSRSILINDQPEDTKMLLTFAIYNAVGNAIFTNIFLPPLPSSIYNLSLITQSAYTLRLNYLAHHIKHDNVFCAHVA